MRWGILINLAVILVFSGVLLFVVFSASLERSAIDAKTQEAIVLADLIESQILNSPTSESMWKGVRRLCLGRTGSKVVLYDPAGNVLGGCSPPTEVLPPDQREAGHRLRIQGVRQSWPARLFRGMTIVVDITALSPHGVGAAQAFLEVPASVFSPAWKFFAGYLILTQLSLFFLGYVLFHRTVIGPVREIARLAGKAAGMADQTDFPDTLRLSGDIRKIASTLKGIMGRIVEDRHTMEALIERLRKTNRELEAAQQGIIRSEKLAGVGRLAAGLAHEIGNPLQIVMGYAEILQRDPDQHARGEILIRMDQELKRIHEILQRLLEFARPIRQHILTTDLNALVRDCGALIQGRKGFRQVVLDYDLDPQLPLQETEPEKIRQVIVNLLFNAADAIPQEGGTVHLRTRQIGNAVEIEVEDTGHGIPEADLEKVFDPFFTTKEPGKGTGLGLAVCLGLVESLGGSIGIHSVVERGTKVVVSLPG